MATGTNSPDELPFPVAIHIRSHHLPFNSCWNVRVLHNLPIILTISLTAIHSCCNPLMATFHKLSSDAIFVVCSQTFALFWLRKMAMPVKIFRLSFRVSTCACPTVTSSVVGKSFHFPFPYFMHFHINLVINLALVGLFYFILSIFKITRVNFTRRIWLKWEGF
jgi:hypothetical protein